MKNAETLDTLERERERERERTLTKVGVSFSYLRIIKRQDGYTI